MIRFIDVNTGNVYNGNTPYVHWFDGKQSIGLNYDKRFIILSDKQDIDIQLDSEVFYLVDPNKLLDENNKVYKYDKEYYNLKTLKTSVLHSTGISYSEYFIHSFNIITQGNYVGEITDDLYIDSERFILGADFYDENESLGINLTNFGAEISNEVQRAIYEKNIDEQKVDFILMNRKFKELLNEYINIIANKGSYKSLLNSLKWFEYGELTSIYEFWKREEPNKNYLTKRDLSSIANSRIEELLSSNTKSTFIGISCALNKIKTIDGEIVYENKYEELPNTLQLLNEPNPELKENALLWSKEDMSLKMTLLGNFFATYFMPIHLDLLFSTIEKIVYTDTIKLVSFPKIDRFDFVDYLDIFKCNIDKTYNLNNIETFTYPDTIFGFENEKSENINYRDEHLEVLGVETSLPNLEGLSENEIFEYGKAYNLQHYKGIGVIIPFRCELVLSNNDVLTKASIKVFRKYINEEERVFEESILERERYDIKYKKEDGKAFVDFNILMKNIGDYKVQLSFRRSDGFEYIKVFNYTVNDDSYQELKMYKLVPKDKTFLDNFEIDEFKKTILGDAVYKYGRYISAIQDKTTRSRASAGSTNSTGGSTAKAPGQPPQNGYKSSGPQSGNVRDLRDIGGGTGTPGQKVTAGGQFIYKIIADKVGKNTPNVFIKPLSASGEISGTNKIFISSGNGYTDCTCYFDDPNDAQDFLNKIVQNNRVPSNIVNLRVVKMNADSNGYFLVGTEFGIVAVSAKTLNEALTEAASEINEEVNGWEKATEGYDKEKLAELHDWMRRD